MINVRELKQLTFEAIAARCRAALGGAKDAAKEGGTSVTVENSDLKSDFHLSYVQEHGFEAKREKPNRVQKLLRKISPRLVPLGWNVSWDLTEDEFIDFLNNESNA